MAGSRKLMLWTITALVVVAMAVAGFFILRYFNLQTIPLMQAVPEQTIVLFRPLEMKNLQDFLEKNKQLTDRLQKIPFTANLMASLHKLDSLMRDQDRLPDILKQNDILIAMARDYSDSVNLMVLIQLSDIIESRVINSFLSKNYEVTHNIGTWQGSAIHGINGDKAFYYSMANGIFCGSHSMDLVKLSLDQRVSKQEAFTDPALQRIMATSGKNVDANLYIKLHDIRDILNSGPVNIQMGEFATLDLMVNNNSLLLNGFIASGNHHANLYNIFAGNDPIESQCPSILPAQTREFYRIGFSNFDSLCCSLEKLKSQKKNGHGSNFNTDKKQFFKNWVDREATIAWTAKGTVAVFRIKENTEPMQDLGKLKDKRFSSMFLGTELFKISTDGMIRDMLWPFSQEYDMPYMCLLNDYVLFGSAEDVLQEVIREYTLGRTLHKSDRYRFFSKNITDLSHLYHYMDLGAIVQSDNVSFSEIIRDKITIDVGEGNYLPVFNGQFSIAGEWFYTNLSFTFLENRTEKPSYIWVLSPDDQYITYVRKVSLSGKEDPALLAFTGSGNAFLVDKEGKIRGRTRIPGEIEGEISTMSSGGDTYLVFNTIGQLHMIDLTGQEATGFPVDLDVASVAGHTLVKYPDGDAYRILVPCADNKIYNFDAEGKPVKGWKHPELSSSPSASPVYLEKSKKDYLIFTDTEGNVLITDRRGRKRIRVRKHVDLAPHSGIYLNQTNSKGLFLTTDRQGHLIYISSKGNIDKTVFGNFTKDHYFIYSDINGDGNRDFVYFDQQQVQVFDRFKKHLFNIKLPEQPASMPLNIQGESKRKSFFFMGKSGIIYQVSHQGDLIYDENIRSDSGFFAWRSKENGMVFIVVSQGNQLILYPF